MAKIKKHYRKNYTQIGNTIIDDNKLSFKALGLWIYMWRQSDDWHFTAELIAKNRHEGITAVRTALIELEQHRYLKREFCYTSGKKSVIYHLSDTKFPENKQPLD